MTFEISEDDRTILIYALGIACGAVSKEVPDLARRIFNITTQIVIQREGARPPSPQPDPPPSQLRRLDP